MKITQNKVLPIIQVALKEDVGCGDVTSKLIIPSGKKMKAVIVAKEGGVVCGLDAARQVFKGVDRRTHFHTTVSDAKLVKAGKVLVCLEGSARSILKAERVALNFLGRLSGVATRTFKLVQKVKPYNVKIMDTRKTTPGLRVLEKYAVRCGGGFNHRMGMWDQVLVKENHLSVLTRRSLLSSEKPLKAIIEKIKQKRPKGIKIEVEVENLQELKQALFACPDIIMLDNFNLKEIKKAVKMRALIHKGKHAAPQLEVSGGVNLDNVRSIAACGVERISIGELTHSAKALDVSLNCE